MTKISKEKLLQTIALIKQGIYNQTYAGGTEQFITGQPASNPEVITVSRVDELYNSTLSLLMKVYDSGSDKEHIVNFQTQFKDYLNPRIGKDYQYVLSTLLGKLNFLKGEIEQDILTTFEKEISGEVYGDLLKMAKEAKDNNAKETAVVLSCAALEDALKRLAKINEIDTEDKTMTEVSNALKGKGFIKSTQGALIGSYIKIRNNAFHAEWNKIEMTDVSSLIAFTEQFIITHF